MAITPKQYELAEKIFDEACELPSARRGALLDERCGGDPIVRREVEVMLAADDAGDEGLTKLELEDPVLRAQAIPERIGSYRIIRECGHGGMGVVYEAEQDSPKRRVALKVIKLGMDTREVIARFEAERQALAMMDHPNIAKVFYAGSTDIGRPYFVMEYIKGVPIVEYCDTEKLDTRARLALFTEVCNAIQHAHQKGIIHRDIKPSNVLVTMHDGRPVSKVIDFGIAKATNAELTQKTLFTEHRQMIGTPAYMSPEQAERTGLDIDTRSDIYSLGVLLYELLTGTTPFDSAQLMEGGFAEMMRIIREDEPHKPSTRLSSLGETGTRTAHQRRVERDKLSSILRGDLDWIVMKCLEKDRTRRYETATGLAEDIRRHLVDEPVVAGPPSTSYWLRKFVKRNRAGVLAGSTIAAVLVLGLAGTTYGILEANAARARETERADELQRFSEFQSEQFGAIVPEIMGARLRDAIVDAAPEEQREALRTTLGRINFTSIGLESLDTNVFDPTFESIDEQFADQPLVQAQLFQALAERLRELGLLDAAMEPQERALAIRRDALGNDDAITLKSADSMGWLLMARGNHDEAEPYLRQTLEGRRRVLGDDHLDTLRSMNGMARLLHARGKLKDAEAYQRAAFEGRRSVLHDEHRDTLASMYHLGVLLHAQGKLDEAEPYFLESMKVQLRVLGPDHPDTLNSLFGLTLTLRAEGRFDEAEPYARMLLEGSRRVFGDDHPTTLRSISSMGLLLQAQGKLAEAEPYFRETLDGRRRVLHDEHTSTLIAINNLGGLLNATGRYAEAESLIRESAQTGARNLGFNHWRIADGRSLLGEAVAGLERYEEAEPLLLESYAELHELLHAGRRRERLTPAAQRLVTLYEAWGKPEEADAWCDRAREARDSRGWIPFPPTPLCGSTGG